MTDADLAAIRQRAEQATKGPWGYDLNGYVAYVERGGEWGNTICALPVTGRRHEDGEFLAHARTDIPALLDRLALLEAQQTALRGALLNVTQDMDRAGGDAYAMPECPWCHWQDDRMEHASDCELLLARELLDSMPLPPAPSPKEQK